ncbi:unnamed protein product [Clonostachys byssicola]|uniref:Peroxin/Ferlin domain-containing protein n=1 Tax=Clonostachys byssicola TaxID=160290 RepID=A0A9N9UMQ6_9HYPO|nr:unnamed protein product [Clonostachys byssicola]
MLRVTSSRRAAGLKPGDFDHNIDLVDHDNKTDSPAGLSAGEPAIERASTESRLLRSEDGATQGDNSDSPRVEERPVEELQAEQELPQNAVRPSIEVQAPTPGEFHGGENVVPRKPKVKRETFIDILYENERGGFLCGRPLFSAAALGGIDASAWTNMYHKPSPTNIQNAQVPDPSWEWVWSEWHLNIQDGTDEGGWEYSFAYSKRFSWHGPRWYNSFVRRRAWTRKRAKKRPEDISADPYMENGEYFTVRPASDRATCPSQRSLSSSRSPSRTNLSGVSSRESGRTIPDIEHLDTLIHRLHQSRIDREKLDATKNYLRNATDLGDLPDKIHEIMALFVFQASRRLLLSHIIQIYDESTKELETKDSVEVKERHEAVKSALKHADEEVRKLAYWSDVKHMAVEASRSETARFGFSFESLRSANGTFVKGGRVSPSQEAPRAKPASDGGSINGAQAASATEPVWRMSDQEPEDGGDGVEEGTASLTTSLVEDTTPESILSEVRNAIATKTIPTNDPTLKNAVFREIYQSIKSDDPLIQEKFASPFRPQALNYPSALSRRANLDSVHKASKKLVAQDKLWAMHLPEGHFLLQRLDWSHIFGLLKAMTSKLSDRDLATMRFVLPENVSFDFEKRRLTYVDLATGQTSPLRASGDRANPTGVILRGPRKALAKAADELIQVLKGFQVFKLGDVTTQDYVTTQLWPTTDKSVKVEKTDSDNGKDSLWLNTEPTKPTTERRVEHLLIPVHWSVDGLSSFIENVIYCHLPPRLDPKLHSDLIEQIGDGALDRNAVKARLIMKVLTDPSATQFITVHTLKLSMAFLTRRGGYIADADRLLSFAEQRGLPMDTDFFNILLEGYASNLDYRHFYALLARMKDRFFQPNARTWLLFLRLVQRNSERQRIVAAMYDLGLFKDPETRRGIGSVFAQREAHLAFKTGKVNIQQFMDILATTYGSDWRTQETLSCILKEYLHVMGKGFQISQLELLLQQQPDDGRPLDARFFNDILEHCRATRDWNLAIWTLQQMTKRGVMPDEKSYDHLIRMAVWTKRQRTLGAILFQAILDQSVTSETRWMLAGLIQGRHKNKIFWRTRLPLVFTRAMLLDMALRRNLSGHDPWHDMVQCILSECGDLAPDQSLAETIDQALRIDNFEFKYQQRLNKPVTFKLKHPDGSSPGRTLSLQHSSDESPNTLSKADPDESWTKLLGHSDVEHAPLSATERLHFFSNDNPAPALSALFPDAILDHEEFEDMAMSSPEDAEKARALVARIQTLGGDEFWGYDVQDAPQPSSSSAEEDGDGILATLEMESGNADPRRVWEYFGFCEAWDVPCSVADEPAPALLSLGKKPTTRRGKPVSGSEKGKKDQFFTSPKPRVGTRILNTSQFMEWVVATPRTNVRMR